MSLRQTVIIKHIELSCVEMMGTSDISDFLFRKAKRLYENRCMDNMFVVEVLKLVWEGEIEIMSFNVSAHGIVSVQLLIAYKLFNRGDIIVGCRVNAIEPAGTLICSAPGATIRVSVKQHIYKVGSIIPVTVRGSEYTLFQSTVSVLAHDFSLAPLKVAEYALAEPSDKEISFAEADELESRMNVLVAEKGQLAKSIMSMFPHSAKQMKPAGTIRDFKAKVGDIVQIRSLPPQDAHYFTTSGETKDYAVLPANEVHGMLLNLYCSTIRKYLVLLEYYEPATFAADQYIWNNAPK